MHGLTAKLAARHAVTVVSLIDETFDPGATARALDEYCHAFTLVPHRNARTGMGRRVQQLRSLLSPWSFQRHRFEVPSLQRELDRLLEGERFDVVKLDFAYLAHFAVAKAPPRAARPVVVVDTHDISFHLLRQVAQSRAALSRRLYAALAWRKLAREERTAYRTADGVCVCSEADRDRVLCDAPSARVAVVPNAADVDFLRPRESDPQADGRTVLFFGLLSTFPNMDGMQFFMSEIWPRIAAERPNARCKIVGGHPPSWLSAMAGPRVEVTGLVEDLRPHLAAAGVVVVPLRLGSGTRLKIVEAMAMGKPIVSTTCGAEGIQAVPGRDLVVADDPSTFAAGVIRILDDPEYGAALGRSGRALAQERYSWSGAALSLERFFREIIAERPHSDPGA